ncbi:MAG: HEAT repeat domain-containing protein [Candidatus Microthrix subdominans]|uniref:HEAT repeat domain-containing protein n=1 Tax=Candidatus Neomicrothrix subdominans TaxID=2954438 RepID=A0A936NDJ3_9ACTN|nr:HEAT repeat domain-containing protein [Candidatus Microthrix sp.]MBK9297428.1 HEAT repeat domain-containing protein [Candidatus Microthrix subdominans]MBK6970147.1 HEAT repeat domain-containing protein [Candidatus Microthrix sp.]MBK7166721.1 HEAT repeat domain-containing protein [Candidatus Microthrix sp.]MBK9561281.1 HEAT repeat domain-containing protein [Candidatus Microthrix sp.]MBP7594201.1 HEAT repeat domain-containing protein [Candidatus Microthrix sp.]
MSGGRNADTQRAELLRWDGLGDPPVASTHPTGVVRSARLLALGRHDRLGSADLIEGLSDDDQRVRLCSLRLAAAHPAVGDEALSEALREALAGDDHLVAEAAAAALGEGDPAAPSIRATVDALADAAGQHPDKLVREAAVAALGSIGHPSGADAVLAANDDVATVRRRAVLALAAFEGPEVERRLVAALKDRDWQVRQGAEDLLDAAPPPAEPHPGVDDPGGI